MYHYEIIQLIKNIFQNILNHKLFLILSILFDVYNIALFNKIKIS